jgi:hypothetical protein
VQIPTLKQNPQTLIHVPYNTHCQTLTNLQSYKIYSKLANYKKKFVNLFTKTPISKQPNQHHTWVFLWGQASMHNYSSYTLFAHTTIPKGTQISFKAFWNYPPTPIIEEPHSTTEAKIPNSRNFHQTLVAAQIGNVGESALNRHTHTLMNLLS